MKEISLRIDCQSCGSSQEVDLRDALLIIAQCLAETAESGSLTEPDGGLGGSQTPDGESDEMWDEDALLVWFLESEVF